MALPELLAEALANSEPQKFELVRRNKKYFVGLKADLKKTGIADLKPLIEEAYSYRKPVKK